MTPHSPEEIVTKLRQVELSTAQCKQALVVTCLGRAYQVTTVPIGARTLRRNTPQAAGEGGVDPHGVEVALEAPLSGARAATPDLARRARPAGRALIPGRDC